MSEIEREPSNRISDRPGHANAEDGIVIVDAPSVALAMTPKAASRMGRRLMRAARTAKQQSAAN